MNEPTPADASLMPASMPTDPARGRLFTLVAPVVGIAVWVVIWKLGFIASIVAWLIAFATIKLYEKGAGGITRKDVPWIVGVIVVSIILAFLSGMASDALSYYTQEIQAGSAWSTLTKGDFWSFFAANLMSSELWSSYVADLLFALGFGALGAYGSIKALFVVTKPQSAAEPAPAPADTSQTATEPAQAKDATPPTT